MPAMKPGTHTFKQFQAIYPDDAACLAKLMAVDHCARYGKVVKFLAAQRYYGGYISFACVWVPYGRPERPLRVSY